MPAETKNDRFRRLARSRGNRILRDLDLLGNLANRNNYAYSPDEVRTIFSTIEEQLRATKQRFAETNGQAKREIVL